MAEHIVRDDIDMYCRLNHEPAGFLRRLWVVGGASPSNLAGLSTFACGDHDGEVAFTIKDEAPGDTDVVHLALAGNLKHISAAELAGQDMTAESARRILFLRDSAAQFTQKMEQQ